MTVTKVVVAKEATPPKKLVRQLSNSGSGSGLSTQKFYKSQDSAKETARTKSEHSDKVSRGGSGTENIMQTESIRDNIVKTLSASLRLRMNNVDDKASFKLKDDEIEDFVRGVEEEMFRYFNGESNSKYKSRYRQLIFNIKDPKNQTLFRKIFYKEVTPVQLAHMSVEELASQELAQWRKQENQHQLDIIMKTELDMMSCSKNLVVKTHKGEEIIDLDHSDLMGMEQSLGVEDAPLLEQSVHAPKVDIFYEHLQSSISRKEYGVLGLKENEQIKVLDVEKHKEEKEKKEDTDKHKHKDREREKEREKQRERDKDKHEKHHRSREKEKQKLRKRSKSRSRSAERSQERPEKRHKSTSDRRRDKDKDKEKERKRHDDKDKEREREKEREKIKSKDLERAKEAVKEKKQSSSFSEASSSNKRSTLYSQKDKKEFKSLKDNEKKSQKPLEAFSLIDLIIENTKTVDKAANLVPEKKKEVSETPTAVVTTTTPLHVTKPLNVQLSPQEPTSTIVWPPQDIYARYTESEVHPLWCGNLNMVDVASFQIVMKPLWGDTLQINKLLPTELDVVGRIMPDTGWDYISKINQSYNKKIVLVQLLPASTTETCAYQVLLQYLAKRNRLGVIKTTSPQIKDFYMFPLVTGKRLPAVLEGMEKNAFFEDNERPDMLIGIIIRVFSKRFHQQSGSGNITLPSTNKHRRLAESSIIKRHSNLAPSAKDDGFDIDEIIKAPIAGKIGAGGGTKSWSEKNLARKNFKILKSLQVD